MFSMNSVIRANWATLIFLFATVLGSSICLGQAFFTPQTRTESDIRVNEIDYREIFEGIKLFPGQTVKIIVKETIDSEHRYWEDRVCSWFGLKCWYELRESAAMHGPDVFPVLLTVSNTGAEQVLPELTLDSAISQRPGNHLPITQRRNPQELTLTLDVKGSGERLEAYASPFKIAARIADKSPGLVLHRNACVGRPTVCGGGSYRIYIAGIDNAIRVEHLTKLLGSRLPPASLIAAISNDRMLLEDMDRRIDLVTKLFEYAQEFHGEKEVAEFIEVLEFAVTLDSSTKVGAIPTALAQAYLKTGNVAQAKVHGNASFATIKEGYEKDKRSPEMTENYYNALGVIAQIAVQERSALYSTDLAKAVSLYIEASSVAGGMANVATKADVKRKFQKFSYEALYDAARVLMMMRTADNMGQAEALLIRAHLIEASIGKEGG